MTETSKAPGISVPLVVAILYLLGFATGLAALAGIILAYLKQDDQDGTWAESHMTYLIRTFWFGLFGFIVGGFLTLFWIGWLVLLAWVIWTFVRCLRSIMLAINAETIPNPETLLW